MKYTITSNQYAAWRLGLHGVIDLIDLAIFDAFKNFANSNRSQKLSDESGTWFWVAYPVIISELPFSGLNTKDAIYRRMKRLEAAKIIQFHPDNQRMGRTFFRWGDNYDAMESHIEPTDENHGVRMKNRRGTDEKPEG